MKQVYNVSIVILILIVFMACTNKKKKLWDRSNQIDTKMEQVVDSLLYYRHHAMQTNLLSREYPNLSREKALMIQMAMLRKELEGGAQQIGWKMGGTVAKDSSNYDPLFGYILDSNLIQEGSTVQAENFPGSSVMVEGEIGFVIDKNFKKGAETIEELKKGINYVVNAVEFAKATAIQLDENSGTLEMNYIVASGMGQVGTILGSGKANIENFDMESESVKCFINDSLVVEGSARNIYGGPLNALYSLVNMLPKYGLYLKEGDIVITGSLYDNPTISSTSNVRLTYNTLGSINFNMK